MNAPSREQIVQAVHAELAKDFSKNLGTCASAMKTSGLFSDAEICALVKECEPKKSQGPAQDPTQGPGTDRASTPAEAEYAKQAEPVQPEPVLEPVKQESEPKPEPVAPKPLSFREIAEPLIKMGVPITPVRPGTKRAFLEDFPTTATTDLAQIEIWDKQFPGHNAACVARAEDGGVWFWEVDSKDVVQRIAKDTGHDALAELQTFKVRSRPGRGHFYFRHNEASKTLGNISQSYVIGQDWSARTNREYVVAPGSIHPDTGEPYEAKDWSIPIAEAPQWLIDWLLSQKVEKKSVSAGAGDNVPRNANNRVPHGSIHGWMLTQAGRLRDAGLNQEEIEPVLLRLVHENCEPPIDDSKVVAMAKSICNYEPGQGPLILNQTAAPVAQTTEPFTFKYSAIQGSHRDYVVAPVLGQKDGWFPLGDPSLIGGASGAGKTTWMLEQLERQSRGEDVYGHKTYGLSYLVIMHDRGDAAFERTMERMSLGKIPVKRLPPITGYAALQAIINKLEEDGADKVPQVVFIEGADMLVEDANKGHFVVPFMSGVQRIAEYYHLAFILSVGAPKMRVGEGYVAKRDSILGSEKWSRMSETVVALQYPEGDDTDSKRACFVMLRNGPPERFDLVFRGGELVINENAGKELKPAPVTPAKKDYLEDAKTWYWKLFTGADGKVKNEVTLMEHRKAEQKAVGTLPENTLRRARVALGISYDHHKQAYCFVEVPPDNTVSLQPAEEEPEALEVGSKFDPENAF